MLSVILTILKIIGIVIAVLIGLILLIVLLVGFVPIRYKASSIYPYEGEIDEDVVSRRKRDALMSKVKASDHLNENGTEESGPGLKIKADAVVSWLLHIVHVSFKMDDTGDRLTVRLFGIFKIYSNDPETVRKKEEKQRKKEAKRKKKEEKQKRKEEKREKKEKQEKQEKQEKHEKNGASLGKEENLQSEKISDDTIIKDADKTSENPADSEENAKNRSDDVLEDKTESKEEKNEEKNSEAEDFDSEADNGKKKSIVDKIKNVYNKIKSVFQKISYVKDMINDERVRNGLAYGKKKLFLIIKRILPKKLKGHVAFGMGDPATTGYITGAAAMFYGVWGRHFELEPDFENKKIEADVSLKGKIVLALLVIPAVKVWFNKDIKYIRRRVGKLKKM